MKKSKTVLSLKTGEIICQPRGNGSVSDNNLCEYIRKMFDD